MKMQLLKEGKNNLSKYIDVYQMIKRFQDMDHLRIILLNQQQLSMFNHISKPTISLKKNMNELELARMDSGTKIANLFQLYGSKNPKSLDDEIIENILSRQTRSDVDGRLLELLNVEINEKMLVKANQKSQE